MQRRKMEQMGVAAAIGTAKARHGRGAGQFSEAIRQLAFCGYVGGCLHPNAIDGGDMPQKINVPMLRLVATHMPQ
jgi:hypothetical protein